VVTFREFAKALTGLGIERSRPVIVHASLSAFGEVHGGAETVIGALLGAFNTVVMPTFTYKTMIIPEVGPEHNGLTYGSGKDTNRMAEFYTPSLPADKLMGRLPETLRRHPKAQRSSHPILSFAGVNAAEILEAQTIEDPLAPIQKLHAAGGWVLLLGVDHTSNTSLHYAERLAGRRQFTRWALTPEGICACPGFPGCSMGFEALAPHLAEFTRRAPAGSGQIQAVPLDKLAETVQTLLQSAPHALLCNSPDCERCAALRA
jgi:aminoglycoside 3-N-acetyltransferase